MRNSLKDATLALAGIFQAAALVRDIAATGSVKEPYFTASIESIFCLNPPSTLSIFGHQDNLQLGLRELLDLFTKNASNAGSPANKTDVVRYAIGLMHLERQFMRNKKMPASLREKIQQIGERVKYFSPTHENIIAALADAYHSTLSQLSYRIHVTGKSDYLRQAHHFERIRALLLAGVRSTVLWRQCGGNRFQLLIKRKAIMETARELCK
ncbi:MAG: hypothetical protein K0R12_485 [Gammaproteobacteria bacterium]|jgi:high frequency lysogenization protein|nr:hypothetical protein [Gammaproteobacteria bacterium]